MKIYLTFLIILNNFTLAIEPNYQDCANVTVSERDIMNAVFKGDARTESSERPVKNAAMPIKVKVMLSVKGIDTIEERARQVRLIGYISMFWEDEFHQWADQFPLSCVRFVVAAHGDMFGIWIPDMAFLNGYGLTRSQDELVRITNKGRVTFSPSGIFEFRCNMDMSLFPFDSQDCTMNFQCWKYSTDFQVFDLPKNPAVIQPNSFHAQWELTGAKASVGNATYNETPFQFSKVDFTVSFKRKAGFYVLNVVVPSLIISMLQGTSFILPVDNSLRLDVSFTCLLAYTVFQVMLSGDLPTNATKPPLLTVYIVLMIVYIGFGTMCQCISFTIQAKGKTGVPVPKWLRITSFYLAKVIGVKNEQTPGDEANNRSDNAHGSQQQLENNGQFCVNCKARRRKSVKQDWKFAAEVFDKCSFITFAVFMYGTTLAAFGGIPLLQAFNLY